MLETLLILLITQVLAMMSPGPDMFLILKNTLGQRGRAPAVATVFGIALGLTVHISVSIAGLGIILLQSETLYRIIRYAGAAYLAYIGIQSFLSHSQLNVQETTNEKDKNWKTAFREGLFTNLLNPKVTLYVLSLFTQLISPLIPVWQKLTYGSVLVAEAILVWWLFVLVINQQVIREKIQKYTVWFDRLFGVILICIAGSVVFHL